MRAAHALHVTIERFDRWWLGAFLLGASSMGCAWAWVRLSDWPLPATLAAVACSIAVLELLRFECRRAPVCLQWDRTGWQWRTPATTEADLRSGQVEVCIDLGAWMLLRFVEAAPTAVPTPWRRRRSMLLPVQRRGHEHAWHALRCAVYSPAARAEPARDAPGSNHPIS